jgi:hypothetical protein
MGISVETPIYINGTATFMNGIVESFGGDNSSCGYIERPTDSDPPLPSGRGVIFFNDGATALGASVNSFVFGNVWKRGNDSFTFPIGNEVRYEKVYAPLTISAPVDAQDVFMATYGGGQLDRAITDSGLYSVNDCEHWLLVPGYQSHDNLTRYIDVTARWTTSSGCDSSYYITNVADVTLAHLNGVNWDSHGGSGEGTTTSGSVAWSEVSDFGAFTLGNVNTRCATPSALSAANITTDLATISWSAIPGAVSYDVSYMPTTLCCWTNALTTATSINLTGLNYSTTYDWKVRANCSLTSSSAYRQTQFTTLAPCGRPTGLTTTNITSSSATLSWSVVANAINYTLQYKQSTSDSWISVATGINTISYNLNGLLPAISYDWRVLAICNEGPGNYAQASFITPACNDVYETNNTFNQAKAISLGAVISANISSTSDVDWFKVTMPGNPNTTLQVNLNNLPTDYDLYVYNKNPSRGRLISQHGDFR